LSEHARLEKQVHDLKERLRKAEEALQREHMLVEELQKRLKGPDKT
jgi:hypothetical protein